MEGWSRKEQRMEFRGTTILASILKELEKKAAKADEVLLASDNDREGEAISYHLKCALESKKIPAKIERIIFNEITPGAIKAAVNAPRDIDMGKVNAQKARRVLDRIVGYNLSPILWKKVKNGLSAGRVQSVALRLICDREAEVQAFTPEEYWSLDVELRKGKGSFAAQLVPQSEEKITFHTKAEVDAFMAALEGKKYIVSDVKTVDKILNPRAPYTTSKLQQDAAIRLITSPGDINLDFADINTIMRGKGEAFMGIGEGKGENMAVDAITNALCNKVQENTDITGATGIILNITSGPDFTMPDLQKILNLVRSNADENVNLIFGHRVDESMKERVSVTIIATGFPPSQKSSSSQYSRPKVDKPNVVSAREWDSMQKAGISSSAAPRVNTQVRSESSGEWGDIEQPAIYRLRGKVPGIRTEE